MKTLDIVQSNWKAEAQNTTIKIGETETTIVNQAVTGSAPDYFRGYSKQTGEPGDAGATAPPESSSDETTIEDDSTY